MLTLLQLSNGKTIALAFLQVQWFVFHHGFGETERERMQGRFSSCVALTIIDDKITHVDQGESYYWIDGKTGKQKKQPMWYYLAWKDSKTKEARARLRSKTFPGIAKAMAEQWG